MMLRVVVVNNTPSLIQLTSVLVKLNSHCLTHSLHNKTKKIILREEEMIKLSEDHDKPQGKGEEGKGEAKKERGEEGSQDSALSLDEEVAHGSLLDPQEPLSLLLDVSYPVDCKSM
jgi:hypothetical protein